MSRTFWAIRFVTAIIMICLVVAANAVSQERLFGYEGDSTYLVCDVPNHSILLTRFTPHAPFAVEEVGIWFLSDHQPAEADIVLLVDNPGEIAGAFLAQPIRVHLFPETDRMMWFRLKNSVRADSSGLLLGVVPRSGNCTVRMDHRAQPPSDPPANFFAQYDPVKGSYTLGSNFTDGSLLNHWYMALGGSFLPSNPLTKRTRDRNNIRKDMTVRMAFSLPHASEVRAVVRDSVGQVIRVLIHKSLNAGMHFISWDRRDEEKQVVPIGNYELLVTAKGSEVLRQKIFQDHTE